MLVNNDSLEVGHGSVLTGVCAIFLTLSSSFLRNAYFALEERNVLFLLFVTFYIFCPVINGKKIKETYVKIKPGRKKILEV